MMVTNIILAVLPVISLFSLLAVVLLIRRYFQSKYNCKAGSDKPLWIAWIVFFITMLSYKVVSSPLTRPTTDHHDKVTEVKALQRNQQQEVIKPELVDNSRKSEAEDLSKTPLLDEALEDKKSKLTNKTY